MPREDYDRAAVEICRQARMEVLTALRSYHRDLAIVGGNVPALLCDQATEPHLGTLDIDLLVNHLTISDDRYELILDIIQGLGWHQVIKPSGQPILHRFAKEFPGLPNPVYLDFLAPEYGGLARKREHQRVQQDLRPIKARGSDLVFANLVVRTIEGRHPGGARDRVEAQVADIVPFLAMKAAAMNGRRKPKDAYDIWYACKYYPGGVDVVIQKLRVVRSHGLVREALTILGQKFEAVDFVGPMDVADMRGGADITEEERAIYCQDSFQVVDAVIKGTTVDE